MLKYCHHCRTNTWHLESFQQKKSHYENTFWGGIQEFFWETIVIGGSTNMALKKLDEMDRIVTCQHCQKARIENVGEEFV